MTHPLERILKELAEDLGGQVSVEKKKKKKAVVGYMTDDHVKEFRKYKEKEEDLEEDMKLRLKQLETQVQRQMRDEFKEKIVEIEEMKENAWGNIYKENGLDPDLEYRLNVKEKKVYELLSEDNPFGL